MTGPQVFLVVWGAGMVALGSVFALRPDVVIRAYRRNLRRYPLGNWLRAKMEPPSYTPVLYRVSRVLLMLLGVVMPILILTGVIPPER
jgi:hypothetical protein